MQQLKQETIYQSNHLVNAKYFLSMDEKKILTKAISHQMAIKNTKAVTALSMNIKELYEQSGETIRFADYSRRVRKTLKTLFDRKIIINHGNHNAWIRWISQITWETDQAHIMSINLSQEIMPYLYNLKEKFTAYKLADVLMLNSERSIRLYELLQSVEKFKTRKFTTNELREYLNCEESNQKFSDFKLRVIEVAIKDINENTNMNILPIKCYKQGTIINEIEFNFTIKNGTSNKTRAAISKAKIPKKKIITKTVSNKPKLPESKNLNKSSLRKASY